MNIVAHSADLLRLLAPCLDSLRRDLNILSMRSVIRNPPTMLLVAQTTAMNPRIVATRIAAPSRRR